MSKTNEVKNHTGVKLYAALTNELTNACYGYAEVKLSSAIPGNIEGETRDEFLYRIVNSVRIIKNSNLHGFIVVLDNYYIKFHIKDGRAIFQQGGLADSMDYKLIG